MKISKTQIAIISIIVISIIYTVKKLNKPTLENNINLGFSFLGSSKSMFEQTIRKANIDHKHYLGANFVKLPDLIGKEIPKYIKYKESILTKPSKQGTCNSCWSFTVTQMIADRISIMTGGKILRNLSPQEMVSCFRKGNSNQNCEVGNAPERAYEYIESNGISTEQDYEYLQKGTTRVHGCQRKKLNGLRTYIQKGSIKNICLDPYKYKEGSERYNKTIEQNVLNMKKELVQFGPFVGTIYVGDSFYNYDGLSVYTGGKNPNEKKFGHAICIIGAVECGVNKNEPNFNYPYWICKNSWGSDWNKHNNGYFYVEMGKNICGIESRASSALPELTDEIKANRVSLDESRYISYDSYINDPERENYIEKVGSALLRKKNNIFF